MSLSDSWKRLYICPTDTAEGLDENHSLKKMLRLVGENKRVIDFGCATISLNYLQGKDAG